MKLRIDELDVDAIDGKFHWRKIYSDRSFSRWYATDFDVDQGSYLFDLFMKRKEAVLGSFEEPDRDDDLHAPSKAASDPTDQPEDPEELALKQITEKHLKDLNNLVKQLKGLDRNEQKTEWKAINQAVFNTYLEIRNLGAAAKKEAHKIFKEYGVDFKKRPK